MEHRRLGVPRSRCGRSPAAAYSGFTMVELLVVIAVIALLVGLLIPGIGHVRAMARESVSKSNLQKWGTGYIGFATDHKGLLPWEGEKDANQMPINLGQSPYQWARQWWWGNVVPPYVDQPAYADIALPNSPVPVPPSTGSIFIDPAAMPPSTFSGVNNPGVFTGWDMGAGSTQKFFFCYVPNANLNNTLSTQMDALPNTDDRAKKNVDTPPWAAARCVRIGQVKKSVITVLMMEMRTDPMELDGMGSNNGKPPEQWYPYYSKAVNRQRSDGQRFAARHRNGGHFLYGDGHVDWFDNLTAITPGPTTANPNPDPLTASKSSDFNRPDLIWDPLGPSPWSE